MAAKMVKTSTPGIFKRGGRYVVVYKVDGRQKKESARTLDEARKLKAARTADIARGEFHEATRTTFREYALEWVDRYQGRGRRGFREHTRDDYRRDLSRYAFEFFGSRVRMTEITPLRIAQFVAWLCDPVAQAKRAAEEARALEAERRKVSPSQVPLGPAEPVTLADATVRRILAPVRSCFASAVQEGLVRHNPTIQAALPNRAEVDEDENEVEDVRVFTREQLGTFLAIVHPRHRVFFHLLAATGLRISEAVALQWQHVVLDGSDPHVKVRRAYVRGGFGRPKSRYGRRQVPLSGELVSAFRRHHAESEWPEETALVFPSRTGTVLNDSNLRNRVLKPAAEEVDASWAGFHTFRHTCASMLFERGRNAKQVQRWLGHHSAAFTLATYVHLMDDHLGDALDLSAEISPPRPSLDAVEVRELDAKGGNRVAT